MAGQAGSVTLVRGFPVKNSDKDSDLGCQAYYLVFTAISGSRAKTRIGYEIALPSKQSSRTQRKMKSNFRNCGVEIGEE